MAVYHVNWSTGGVMAVSCEIAAWSTGGVMAVFHVKSPVDQQVVTWLCFKWNRWLIYRWCHGCVSSEIIGWSTGGVMAVFQVKSLVDLQVVSWLCFMWNHWLIYRWCHGCSMPCCVMMKTWSQPCAATSSWTSTTWWRARISWPCGRTSWTRCCTANGWWSTASTPSLWVSRGGFSTTQVSGCCEDLLLSVSLSSLSLCHLSQSFCCPYLLSVSLLLSFYSLSFTLSCFLSLTLSLSAFLSLCFSAVNSDLHRLSLSHFCSICKVLNRNGFYNYLYLLLAQLYLLFYFSVASVSVSVIRDRFVKKLTCAVSSFSSSSPLHHYTVAEDII